MTYIKKIDGKWYAFEGDALNNTVKSIGKDNPDSNNKRARWCARWNDYGIKYVASPSPSRNAAYQKARRWDDYGGEV